jgi:DNA helicase II / ATP-dependent DNA helicase PcrA
LTPEIIIGCPGAGKTTVLLAEVERELTRGTPPDRLGLVTFTRRAAEEAVTRSVTKFNLTSKQLPHFRTIHSLCFRALGLTSSDVFAGNKIREFADWAGIRVTGKYAEDGDLSGHTPGDRALHLEHLARVRGVSLREQYDAAPDDLPWREVERCAAALSAFKRGRGLLDFTDMLSEVVRASDCLPRLDVLIVDEAQDQSSLQWLVVWQLAKRARRLIVAADDDQCIFRWAGADVEGIVTMAGDERVLGQSHRVPVSVQKLADKVIGAIPPGRRRQKRWAPRAEPGDISYAADLGEAGMSGEWEGDIQPVLLLARNVYLLREQVIPELRRTGVIFSWGDRQFPDKELCEAAVTWEHLRAGKSASVDRVRGCLRLMSGRGVERGHRELPGVPDEEGLTIDQLEKNHGLKTKAIWTEALDRMPADDAAHLVAARQRGERLLHRPRIRLSTIHAAKGGEARHVVLLREMAARTYSEMTGSLQGEEDERRVFYVGVTRARERLTVVEPRRREACPWV